MKIARVLGVVLAAAVVPAAASAQSTDPNTTNNNNTGASAGVNAGVGTNGAGVNANAGAGVNGTGVNAGAGVNAGSTGVNAGAGVNAGTNANPTNTTPPPAGTTVPDPNAVPPAPTTVTTETTTPPPVVVVQPTSTTPATTFQPETEEEYDAWNAPVFTTGAVLFGGSYAAAAIVSGESDHPGANRLWVPVVGPWLALNDWGSCPIDQPRCDTNTTDKVLLIADGVVQAAGILTMVDGLLMPSHHKVVRRTVDTKVHVTPTGNGLAVFGHF